MTSRRLDVVGPPRDNGKLSAVEDHLTTPSTLQVLSPQDLDRFVEQGYLVVSDCFAPSVALEWCEWCEERVRTLPPDFPALSGRNSELPPLITVNAEELAPKAWAAACDLAGGRERVRPGTWRWSDCFIVNL